MMRRRSQFRIGDLVRVSGLLSDSEHLLDAPITGSGLVIDKSPMAGGPSGNVIYYGVAWPTDGGIRKAVMEPQEIVLVQEIA